MDARELECRSSAVTLSDMELFVFPELLYSLVLANIMSPRLWKWREDPWFDGLERMKPYRRISRLKQFIMDHYIFNLDLDTWGLTTKEREIGRFRSYLDMDILRKANALFGYEGDKYYFDIDIRSHFGLDKYEGNIIPYWKTETVEAMDAFRFKPGYQSGAGECVSLATLYAAALFLVARIPLSDIFLMATPLHSQNFVDVEDGILTNNRRLVTRNMWFNGTALSGQARRALEHENVTIVSHESGLIHVLYDEATIAPEAYARYTGHLKEFLKAPFTQDLFGNFLRQAGPVQKCFQLRWSEHGMDHYIGVERVFEYERGGPYLLTDSTRAKLMEEIDKEEFQHHPLPGRVILNDLEDYIRTNKVDLDRDEDRERLKGQICPQCMHRETVIESLMQFCRVEPRLPDALKKRFHKEAQPLDIDADMSREEIVARLESIRGGNRTADMAFHAYRDLGRIDAGSFLKAAVERNPVSCAGAAGMEDRDVAEKIRAMPEVSVYDEAMRLAQPDEVWNFGRGDGVEKALLLADILYQRAPDRPLRVEVEKDRVLLRGAGTDYEFSTGKQLAPQSWNIENYVAPEVHQVQRGSGPAQPRGRSME